MKNPDRFEITLYWSIVAIVIGFSVWLGLTMMTTKNKMCRDFGKVVYHRELSWLECIVL